MTIRLEDTASVFSGFPIYSDDQDDMQFWYLPSRYGLRKVGTEYDFFAQLNPDNDQGFSTYRFNCAPVPPAFAQTSEAMALLKVKYGERAVLSNYYFLDSCKCSLRPITDLPLIDVRCDRPLHSFDDFLECRFAVPAHYEPDFSRFLQTSEAAWAGQIDLSLKYAKVVGTWRAWSTNSKGMLRRRIFSEHPDPEPGEIGPFPVWDIYDAEGKPGLFYRVVEDLLKTGTIGFKVLNGAVGSDIECCCDALLKSELFYREQGTNKIYFDRWNREDDDDRVHVEQNESRFYDRLLGFEITLGLIPKECFVGFL